nr:MAG TPA: hypothetical protein [Caudoviricetes sp.]
MKKISFTEVEDVKIKLESVRSLMIALEYGIFDSFESKEIFRVGYANLVEQVHGIQKELDRMMNRMTSQIQKDSEEEIA